MPVERTLPITRSRAREMGSQSCPDDEKIIENAAFGQQNPSLVESHFNPRNEQKILLNQWSKPIEVLTLFMLNSINPLSIVQIRLKLQLF